MNEFCVTGLTIDDVAERVKVAREAYRQSVLDAQNGLRDTADHELRSRALQLTDLLARMIRDAEACGIRVKAAAA